MGAADIEEFDLSLQDGVPVFHCHGTNVLIDTGCPISFGHGPIQLNGQQHVLADGFPPLTIDHIALYVGGVQSLLGTDLLMSYRVLLDVPRGRVIFSANELTCEGVEVSTPLVAGVPTTNLTVGGTSVVAVLDTGAGLSYMDPAAVQTAPVDREEDFHPTLGRFETDVYEVEVELAGVRHAGRFGILPQSIRLRSRWRARAG